VLGASRFGSPVARYRGLVTGVRGSGRLDGMADTRVTEGMVTRASHVLWTEVNPEYQADPRDFTDADIAAGKLREADDADISENRAIVRRVLEAAFPDAWLPDDVRELLTDLSFGGWTVEQAKGLLASANRISDSREVELAEYGVRAAELLAKYPAA